MKEEKKMEAFEKWLEQYSKHLCPRRVNHDDTEATWIAALKWVLEGVDPPYYGYEVAVEKIREELNKMKMREGKEDKPSRTGVSTLLAEATAMKTKAQTITIDEFKKLKPNDSPDRKQAYGNFAISTKAHRNQCENLEVGDKVFYINIQPDLSDPAAVDADINLVEAIVVVEGE